MSNNIKILRYESLIKDILNNLIKMEVQNKIAKFATITYVKLSSDLSNAKIYLDCLDRSKIDNVINEINKLKGFFRTELSRHLTIYKTPTLSFYKDATIDYVDNIEKLFKQIKDKNE